MMQYTDFERDKNVSLAGNYSATIPYVVSVGGRGGGGAREEQLAFSGSAGSVSTAGVSASPPSAASSALSPVTVASWAALQTPLTSTFTTVTFNSKSQHWLQHYRFYGLRLQLLSCCVPLCTKYRVPFKKRGAHDCVMRRAHRNILI